MDVEQLKLILETLEAVGGETKEVVVWIVVSRLVPYVLGWIGGITLAVIVTRFLHRTIIGCSETYSALKLIGEELGHKLKYVNEEWRCSDTKKVLEQIAELKK